MKVRSIARILAYLGASLGMLFLGSGCSTKPIQPNLVSEVSSAYVGASIQVDLIGVNPSELGAWTGKSIDDYFSAGDRFRQGAVKRTLQFGGSNAGSQTLAAKDTIWAQWKAKSATHIIVLADLPGYNSPEGGVDLRRQVIPLDSGVWDKVPPSVMIQITPTGIILVPAPKVGS